MAYRFTSIGATPLQMVVRMLRNITNSSMTTCSCWIAYFKQLIYTYTLCGILNEIFAICQQNFQCPYDILEWDAGCTWHVQSANLLTGANPISDTRKTTGHVTGSDATGPQCAWVATKTTDERTTNRSLRWTAEGLSYHSLMSEIPVRSASLFSKHATSVTAELR